MKQVLQDLRKGMTVVEDVPEPATSASSLLVRTSASIISAGSERTIVEFGQASLVAKARSQPDKVRQVIDKIRTDGVLPTLEAVFSKLDEPMPLGYCNAGVVLDVGPEITTFALGDRVVSNGQHAEVVSVPKNLCCRIPENVADEQAAFTVLASIALQGIRLTRPELGEKVVVFGLGLIGLIAVQLLRCNGCQVLGIDLDSKRLSLAEQFGAKVVNAGREDPVAAASAWTGGKGVDAVLVTASAKTDDIVHQSAQMCRKRGRIVLVGVVGLNLRRSDFYEKEISFQVSCSYGPGRYDEAYERRGLDYPYGFVRWTEQRNFDAVLEMLASGLLDFSPLITHRYHINDAPIAYKTVTNDHHALGVLLEYPQEVERTKCSVVAPIAKRLSASPRRKAVVGVIGAGSFAHMILMPSLKKTDAAIGYVADRKGNAAHHLARKFGAHKAVTDYKIILDDEEVNTVLVAVRHDLHARLVCEALSSGKHVFVEKPLAMNLNEIQKIVQAAKEAPRQLLMVGFNRRFSSHIVKIREFLSGRGEPLAMNITVNAGFIPPDHWIHDPEQGGGRIVGEACHFIDLLAFLAGSPVATVAAVMMDGGMPIKEDKMSISLGFADGSVGSLNYFANGSKTYPKETLEVFSDQRIIRMENFRRTVGFGFQGFRKFKTFRQDKGHAAEFRAFIERVTSGGEQLIELKDLVNVTLASFAAVTAARERRTVILNDEYQNCLNVAEGCIHEV